MTTKIAIGLCTCFRPKTLLKALNAVNKIELPQDVEVLLIVVDNDKEGSAKKTVEEIQSNFSIPIHYFIEPTRGIPFARNRVLKEATNLGATEIAFFDDDAEPDKDWLINLYNYYAKNEDVDVVTGPEVNYFEHEVPDYVKSHSVFNRSATTKNHKQLDMAATNNVLFSLKKFNELGLRFDESFGLRGGSDSDLFYRAHLKGIKIVFIKEAITRELVQPARANLKWILKRQFRLGLEKARLDKKHSTDILFPVKLFLIYTLKLALYTALLPLDYLFRRKKSYNYLGKISKALGPLAFLLNIKIEEYKTVITE